MRRILLLIALITSSADAQKLPAVHAWEGTVELPTYQEGVPDRNPPFDEYATDRFNYPYTLRTQLTGEKKLTKWRALFLDNEYLRCTILPDIGGHLYTCVDKLNGQPMFYDNSTIKKAEIGYRGAWAAFGIEFNFPVSHNWVSMSPVDFSLQQNADGSASIHVGNTDRVYGMHWEVELILRPGQTVLEEDVHLANLSDVRQRYYWWNNAAVRVWDDSRIDYPMKYTASHGFVDIAPWPMTPDGRDQRIIAQQTDGPVSRFIYGSREPYMGIWNPHTNSGVAHYSEYAELPGKKIWSWGSDQEGRAWRTALSDDDSAYVEVQAGLYRNQETYAFLGPAQTLHFHEYWMPVRETGGITRANRAGVLYLHRDGDELHAALNVNRTLPHAQVELSLGDKVLWKEAADLSPRTTWKHNLAVTAQQTPVRFVLRSEKGDLLLAQTEGKFDWDADKDVPVGQQPRGQIPEKGQRTLDDWLRDGDRQELLGRTQLALDTYQQAEKRFPAAMSLKLATGRVLVALERYREALPLLEICAAADTANAHIAYLLGLAREGTGNTRGALAAYEMAYRQAELRAAAGLRLGELHAGLGDTDPRPFIEAAAAASPEDQRIGEERAIADNVSRDDAVVLLGKFPLSAALHELAGTPWMERLASDPYLTLQTAGTFMRLGRWEQAFAVLTRTYPEVSEQAKEPGYTLPQDNPLVLYAAALCADHLGRDARPYLQRAQAASMTWVFPSTQEDEMALRFALAQYAKDAQAHALLGDLLFSRGLVTDGLSEWKQALLLRPEMPVIGVQMAKAQLLLLHDTPAALQTLQVAVVHDARNAAIYEMLDEAMSLAKEPAAARARDLERYPDLAAMPAPLLYQLALAKAEAGDFDGADRLFKGRFFPREEGGVSAGQVQFEIAMMRAEASARSGKCDVRPMAENPDGILNDSHGETVVRLAKIAESCRRHEEAEAWWAQAAKLTGTADAAWAEQAAKHCPGFDAPAWRKRLQAALASARQTVDATSYRGWWLYQIAVIQGELGEITARDQAVEEVFRLPDSLMSHHLARQLAASK